MSEVTIYTKPGCPYCAAAMEDLKKRGVSYIEFDVTASKKYADDALKHSNGQRTVPIIVTAGEVKVGFNGG
ncbi:MAG: glutaredoxin family protein [candidate division Zixibacteria bacterium]|nr:glutaredoxin family protein [candidate division Zixibacteria bacterium]MBU1471886.1 glutaredoxin family protein [candidate division Zixibacteria bacterium]MBU2625582.1 glutaredoxin family protein [candidate division Zixibacteria bacterium]